MSEMPEIQKNNSAKTEASGVVGQPTSVMPVLGDKNEVMEQNVAKPTMPAPAPSVAPAVSASQASGSAESAPKISGSESVAGAGPDKSDGVEFTTQNIGAWKSKQEDPFAKQNQEIAEKKAKRAETRKKLQPYFKWGAIGLGVAAVIAVVVVVLVNVFRQPEYEGPTIGGGSSDDVRDLANQLHSIYREDEEDGRDQVNAAIDDLLQTSQGQKYETQVKLAQLNVFYRTDDIEGASTILGEIDVDSLDTEQQLIYYNAAYMVAAHRKDTELTDKYFKTIVELKRTLVNQE